MYDLLKDDAIGQIRQGKQENQKQMGVLLTYCTCSLNAEMLKKLVASNVSRSVKKKMFGRLILILTVKMIIIKVYCFFV